MRVSAALYALGALAAPAAAQNVTFLQQLAQQLQNLGLSSLANATSSVNQSTTGQALLSQLGSGPQTIFAPNNDAWAGAYPNVTSDAETLAQVLSYHVVPGTFTANATFPNTTVARTLLNSSSQVFLEGNKAQVLAWTDQGGTLTILNQNTPNVVVNSTTIGNITLHVTSAVIDIPGDLADALAANNLTQFRAALEQASLFGGVATQHGVTLFAPTDEAFTAAQQNLTAAGSNSTLLTNILRNHVINGTSVYSGNLLGLSGSNETTAAGEGLSSVFNSTGGYVSVGNATAKITTPDIILWNGVLHIIDSVLLNEEADESAASSALSSATAAATSSATEGGPIGFTQTASGSAASGVSSDTGAASSSASLSMSSVPLSQVGFASATSVLGVVFGGYAF